MPEESTWDAHARVWRLSDGAVLPSPGSLLRFDEGRKELHSTIIVVGSAARQFLGHVFAKTPSGAGFQNYSRLGEACFSYLEMRLGVIRGYQTVFHLYAFPADDRLSPLLLEEFAPYAHGVIVAHGTIDTPGPLQDVARSLGARKRRVGLAVLASPEVAAEWTSATRTEPVFVQPFSDDTVFPSLKEVARRVLTILRDEGDESPDLAPRPNETPRKPWWKFW